MALSARTTRRLLGLGLLLLILAGILASFRADDVWHWLLKNDLRTRQQVNERPVVGFVAGLTAYTLISFVPGLIGKSLAVAWLFGFWRSLAIVNLCSTLVAIVEFFFTRYLLRDLIQSRFGLQLIKVNKALERDGAFYLFSMRVAHVPYTATNYLMGATSIKPLPYWFATQLGLLPSNIVICYAGSKLPSLAEVSQHGLGQIMTPQLWIGFVLLAISPWLAKWIVGRLRRN
jgi:uncharacterized membrane protein YdjX (TVP38/TMEM64 family)